MCRLLAPIPSSPNFASRCQHSAKGSAKGSSQIHFWLWLYYTWSCTAQLKSIIQKMTWPHGIAPLAQELPAMLVLSGRAASRSSTKRRWSFRSYGSQSRSLHAELPYSGFSSSETALQCKVGLCKQMRESRIRSPLASFCTLVSMKVRRPGFYFFAMGFRIQKLVSSDNWTSNVLARSDLNCF